MVWSTGFGARRMAVSGAAEARGDVEANGTEAMSTARGRAIITRIIQFPFFLNDFAEIKHYSGGGAQSI
ncbi:MAG TPA: hypothetical protein VMW72_07710 [Sedimentisphaerales bacterium]|nr:hypothetical protein [Sedimentisphaerales bacterium]